MEQETIAAIATPFGSGGIGIIRISGSKSTAIARALFRRHSPALVRSNAYLKDDFASHYLTHGYIVDGNKTVDEVLITFMKSPNSYTREDVVEIQSHSGAIVLRHILQLVISTGARLAEPGEFTKRAYLNGRIDLSQAEAVADVISAKSEAALNISTNQLIGALKTEVDHLRQCLDQILAQLEAHLEFSDEMDGELDLSAIAKQVFQKLMDPTIKLLDQYNSGHFLREGVRMGIVGRPNVGKSSLLNCLLSKDKAIVTHLPGTTRDLIEDAFSIKGIPIIVTDTAGLHPTDNPIEKIGIQKTHESISRSDLVLFVVDGSQPINIDDEIVFQKIRAKKVIMVINKMDLLEGLQSIRLPEMYKEIPQVMVSALRGDGIDTLKTSIAETSLGEIEIDPGRTIVPNMRQKLVLDLALGALESACSELKIDGSEELIIEDLKTAKGAFNQIVGQDVEVEILDEIFNRFCIGK